MTEVTDEHPLVRQPWFRSRTVAIVGAGLGLVLIVVLAVVAYQWRHSAGPTVFDPATGRLSETTEARAGVATWVGMTYPSPRHPDLTVHIDAIQARVVADTADARVSFFLCSNIQPPGPGTLALGTADGDVSKYCSALVPARNVDLVIGHGHFETIVMKVLPPHPGRVHVNGIDVRYSAEGRHGTQWTGEGIIVFVHGKASG